MADDATKQGLQASPAKTESTAPGSPSPKSKKTDDKKADPNKKDVDPNDPRGGLPSIFLGLGNELVASLLQNDMFKAQGMVGVVVFAAFSLLVRRNRLSTTNCTP